MQNLWDTAKSVIKRKYTALSTFIRREDKSKGENERYLKAEFQRIARRDKKAFLVIDAKK